MSWTTVDDKFERLSGDFADAALRGEILDAVARLESIKISDLTTLLEHASFKHL